MTSLAHFIYVAEGFMEDCSMLIQTLTNKYERVDWQKFCKHWKELQFDVMFYNRLSGAELVELTEECFQCARLYMVTETDNYEDQVVAIFIAYAISIIQPYTNLCSLRLTPQDVAPLKKVEAIARRHNRTDVLMILGKLYVYSTHYHVCTRERAMDYGIRKYFDDSIRVPKATHKLWHGVLNRNNIKSWERISAHEKIYEESKKHFMVVTKEKYKDCQVVLDMTKPIADEIADSLRQLIIGPKKEKCKGEKDVNDLKMKAMKNVVNPIRHLTGVDQRKAVAVSTPLAESPAEIQPKPTKRSARSKIKENSQNIIKPSKEYIKPTKKNESKMKATAKDLPILDDVIQAPISITKADTPETPFKGFTAGEIERTNASLCNFYIEGSRNKETKKKRKNGKQTSISRAKTSYTDLEDSNNIQKRKINGKKLPQFTSEIINNKNIETKKRKVSPKKIEKKKRGSKLFNESDSNTDDSAIVNHLSDDDYEPKTAEIIDENNLTKDSKDGLKNLIEFIEKELKPEGNGEVNDFVQYKINDIVIHADQGLPDLEFELIDQYTGPVDNDEVERTPETTEDRDISEHDIPENTNVEIEPMDTEDGSEETVEVVRILTESEAAVLETRESLVVPRRKRKRPSLQSKLRKMGILPVANFYNDDVDS